VLGIDKDDLVVLVGGVLVDPVRVQDAQVGAAAADTLLGGGLEGSLVLKLVHTLVGGLACISRPSASRFISAPWHHKSGWESWERQAYRKWHPWGRVACGHHVGRARGR
jgi:hypothetical protein